MHFPLNAQEQNRTRPDRTLKVLWYSHTQTHTESGRRTLAQNLCKVKTRLAKSVNLAIAEVCVIYDLLELLASFIFIWIVSVNVSLAVSLTVSMTVTVALFASIFNTQLVNYVYTALTFDIRHSTFQVKLFLWAFYTNNPVSCYLLPFTR